MAGDPAPLSAKGGLGFILSDHLSSLRLGRHWAGCTGDAREGGGPHASGQPERAAASLATRRHSRLQRQRDKPRAPELDVRMEGEPLRKAHSRVCGGLSSGWPCEFE